MSKSFWQPFKSERKKKQEMKTYEKVGKVLIVRNSSETDSDSSDDIIEDYFKKNDNPSKNIGSCKSPKSSVLTSTPKMQRNSSYRKLDIPGKNSSEENEKYVLQKQMSCPDHQKPSISRALHVPEVRRQHSFDETKRYVIKERSKDQNQEHIVTKAGDTDDCHCKIDFPNDQGIKVSCKIVPKPTSPAVNIYGNIVSEELNNNGDVSSTRLLQLKIENIRNIPPSGKIGISVELPTSILQHVQVGPSTSTVVEVRTHSPMGNNIWITENVNVTKTSRLSLDGLQVLPSKDYLTVDQEFRPRSNSDSRVNTNMPKPGSRDRNRKLLPGITVEDFSLRKAELQKKLEGQSNELRLDLCGDDDFFSLLQGRRRRSFTCPEEVLSRPNSAELHREPNT